MANQILNIQPVIQTKCTYQDHSFKAIDPCVLKTIRTLQNSASTSTGGQEIRRLTLLLECFLQITGNTIDANQLRTIKFQKLTELFIGALNSDKFVLGTFEKRHIRTRTFIKILTHLQSEYRQISVPQIDICTNKMSNDISLLVRCFNSIPLIEEAVYYWKAWPTTNDKGKAHFLPLTGVYLRLGREFTDALYFVCNAFYSGRSNAYVPGLSSLSKYIGQYPSQISPADFKDPRFMTKFWREYLRFYMVDGYKSGSGSKITTLITLWRNHIRSFIEDHLEKSGLFATPAGGLPVTPVRYVPGPLTNVKVSKCGQEIKTKLLTHIPLHLTDKQALERKIDEIQSDHATIVAWAEYEINDIWVRYQNRRQRAAYGEVRQKQSVGARGTGDKWLTSRDNPNHFDNAAATFEHYGYLEHRAAKLLYPRPFVRTAEELALPGVNALFPHCVVLVSNHPEITASGLENFELFDKNGKQTGFVFTDSGYKLVLYKPRRGAKHAQQIISLNDRTAEVVQQIISLTQPLRDYLKSHDNSDWRYLLLTSKRAFGHPCRVRSLSSATCIEDRVTAIAERIGIVSRRTYEERYDLVRRLSLPSLRGSSAVLVFIRTHSVEEMAKSLGHKEFRAKLISHYLPAPLISFFKERWIRIFQTSLIVEALKDSKYLSVAAGFSSVEELDEFLRNHALKFNFGDGDEAPEDLISAPNNQIIKEVVFGVNEFILTSLISLQIAVERAGTKACNKALQWSLIGQRIIEYIDSNAFERDDIKLHLHNARANATSFDIAGVSCA